MRDPATGRLYRGPGEPERFDVMERPVSEAVQARVEWLRRITGYEVDPRSVQLTEALRKEWYENEKVAGRRRPARRSQYFKPQMQELRTSERKTFGTCPKQWWWSYVEQLAPARAKTALWFGSAVHDALAGWYLPGLERGPHPAETFAKVLDGDRSMTVTNEAEEVEWVDARELGIAMLTAYVEHFGLDETMHVLAIEHTGALLFKRNGKAWLRYLLTIDGLFRDLETGEVFILEHKTAKAIRPGFLNPGPPLALDNQAGSYYAAAPYVLPVSDLLKPGERIAGIRYNMLRKAAPDDRPVNADGHRTNKPKKEHYGEALATVGVYPAKAATLDTLAALAAEHGLTVLGDVSKDQPPPYFHREDVFRTPEEQVTQLRRIEEEGQMMARMRNGDPDLPVIKIPGDHCSWCPFQRMCELDESGDREAVESFKAAVMTVRDPYEAYRKAA